MGQTISSCWLDRIVLASYIQKNSYCTFFFQAVPSWEGSRATNKAGLNLLWETKLKYTGENNVYSIDIIETVDCVDTEDIWDIIDTI